MSMIVEQIKGQVQALNACVPKEGHLKTGEIRRLSAKAYRALPDKSRDAVFAVCEELLECRDWSLGVIAFDWAYRVREQYDGSTYRVFYRWLEEYVRGWGDCDDFCTHAFGELLRRRKELFEKVLEWTAHPDFWVRRAAAVVLIPSILREDSAGIEPLKIADRLLTDDHDLVQKGYGWMLKCLSQVEPETVIGYLEEHYREMPRTAFRYALEKIDPETRKRLMSL